MRAMSDYVIERVLPVAGLLLFALWGALALTPWRDAAGLAFHGMLACLCGGLALDVATRRDR